MSQNSVFSSVSDFSPNKPIHEPRDVKIICVGAGASGLLLAYKLQRSFTKFEFTIYEKNEDISGTWLENTYPGCACDIPAHNYTYSFEPNPNWSSVYAGSAEIRQYFNSFANKYDLHKYIQLKHQVSAAVWNDRSGQWEVEITDLTDGSTKKDSCHILINAGGVLNSWKWPDIVGLQDYKGSLLHTARWDASVDLKGKHVGLIGNGSSAIQVLPAIAPIVSKVTSFIRGPTYVAPVQAIEARQYTEEERENFKNAPEAHLAYRKKLESGINSIFAIFLPDSVTQKATAETVKEAMKSKLTKKGLEKYVIPDFPIGCRRFTPGVNYLETLSSDKVEVVSGEIERVTERGVVSAANGQEYPVDVLICATGFDTSFRPRFPLVNGSGKNLADVWAQEPRSYFGMAAHDFPNYFMFIGPSSPSGNGPIIYAIETQADFMLKFINRWQTENIHSFSPKMEAIDDFIAFKDEFMKNTVWQRDCKSWYKDRVTGKVIALWPGSSLHYIEAITDPRYDDFDFRYSGNRYAYLGSGFSQVESDRTADWAYYIRNEDNGPHFSRVKQLKITSKSGTIVREEEKEGALAVI